MNNLNNEKSIQEEIRAVKKQTFKVLAIGLIGLIAGIVSCLFAEVISAIVSQKMNLEPQLHFEIWLILPLLMLVLCALIGRYRLSYLSDIAPLQSLRELNQ